VARRPPVFGGGKHPGRGSVEATSGLLGQLIAEQVGALAARERVDGIVRRALDDAGLERAPTEMDAVSSFVRRQLHAVLVDELGSAAAEEICGALEEILRLRPVDEEESGIRPRTPRFGEDLPDYEEGPTCSVPAAPPVVIVASASRVRMAALESALRWRACVIRVTDAVELYDALRDPFTPVALVIDCSRPQIEPETAAALAPDMPRGMVIVLWGAPADSTWHIMEDAGHHGRWIPCRAEAGGQDVAALCLPPRGHAPT